MASESLDRLLSQLEELRRSFGADDRKRVEKIIARLGGRRFPDADSLIRFHEALLFLRAYPHSRKVLRLSEQLLSSFQERVEWLRSQGRDMSAFDYAEASGIAGTSISAAFSYWVVRRLVERYPTQVEIDWQSYEKKDRMAATWPRFLPLLEEDSLVEANVPYRGWLHAANGRNRRDLAWLIRCFDRLRLSEKEKAELYDSLELPIRWELEDSQATRSRMRGQRRRFFYHRERLLRRSDISIEEQFDSPPLPLKKLTRAEGEKIISMARETSVVRYRELYGFTYGDAERVFRVDAARGVEIFLMGLPPERRLPLRAYHAGFILKNGVPVGYVEGLTLFDRMEIGFNLYYSFRDGESAWLYARVLKLFHQVLGVTCFSVDPYQIGFHNEEAIESGAFWFYRKLGFRPTNPRLTKLVETEEKKILANRGYRTAARVLRRLSTAPMVFDVAGASKGDWDSFHTRGLGLAVQRRMAKDFGGDAGKIRNASSAIVARALGISHSDWKGSKKQMFENLALVLALIPDLGRWTKGEKSDVARIVRSKMSADEKDYVLLLQNHPRLRRSILNLGSSAPHTSDAA